MTEPRNRLAGETSPYLQQHASNPVDWYPWGDEALSKARTEDKPIFLSIGYSACHWCHVMERESFENESIAAIMNRHFVNVKVDREERPDLDDFYMTFVQMTTGGGGWPMSVFLTPDGKPFFGGTYFPPEDAYGRRGFSFILTAVADTWSQQRQQVLQASSSLLQDLHAHLTKTGTNGVIDPAILDQASRELLDRFDPIEGGFGGAPKFPPSFSLSFLMKQYHRTGDQRVLRVVTHTLDKMAAGGIHDQLGGGFHRYAVDGRWLVPHFEKMLYDNALLAVTYLEAYQLTNITSYLETATGILDYVLRDMRDHEGGFHSSEDADSDGHEGKYYVWTQEEVISFLGTDDGRLFCDYYGVTDAGNFEGHRSILHFKASLETFAEAYHLSTEQLQRKLAMSRTKLLEERGRRVRPPKDDKVLTEWNGLMLSALARGYQVTGDDQYLTAAIACARFIEDAMYTSAGLLRVYRQGRGKQPGFLSDYAALANGLVDLYEAIFDSHWLVLATRLAEEMTTKFSDASGGFYLTAVKDTNLPIRQKDSYDGAVPSGNSTAVTVLLRLSALLDRRDWRDMADRAISSLAKNVQEVPSAHMNLLNAYDLYLNGPVEITIVGRRSDEGTRALVRVAHKTCLANRTIALLDPDDPEKTEMLNLVPSLRDRPQIDGQATAYVCVNRACQAPVTNAEDLARELSNARA
jgi:uncharacterized protein